MDSFASVTPIMVHWGDMDALGHVNNTVTFRWFETSRIGYLESSHVSRELQASNLGPILAATNCNYRRQLHFPDTVMVGTRVSRLGRSSMTLQHAVYSEQLGEIAADGESVVVVFDFDKQRPIRIPDLVRDCVLRLQPDLSND